MEELRRYFRLFAVQQRASLQLALTYRADFFLGIVLVLFWLTWNLVPVFVVWKRVPEIAGWTLPEALVVIAFFLALRALLEGAINPSLIAVVDHIRKGTFDFILLKPADAQFLVSTARIDVWRLCDSAGAAVLFVYAFVQLGRVPSASQIAVAAVLGLSAACVLYSISILVIASAFWVVRIGNLSYLFNSIFDAARWPATIFRGAFRFVFTFVIPLALMTTYPALALLGKLEARVAVAAIGGALALTMGSRLVWTRAIGRYTSASS